MVKKIKIFKTALIISLFILLLSPSVLFAQVELYDAPGFDPNREAFTSMPNEQIDPFTGGLTISHEDIRLPGNGGLDLVIQRTFNSKNVCGEWTYFSGWYCSSRGENTWLGYGWTLHFGRLFKSTNVNIPHIVEMQDGSMHTAYKKTSSTFITKDYWLLDIGSSYVLTLTDGTKIYYEQNGPPHPDFPQHPAGMAGQI